MGMLDPVKCLIGQLQQIIQVCRILGVPRHADTCGDDKCMLLFSLIFRDHPRIDRLIHASGDKSFYDAIDISATPIVCSHSNCRSLCDHPRNLTDDQLRALAKCGGVAHTTFYPGFLNAAGEADIMDAVAHLEHAISIMGIDHVGIGTDFDGDGGVPGMADASEVINFTIQLLRRRYSEEDIRKIWGGNWMRVMGVKS